MRYKNWTKKPQHSYISFLCTKITCFKIASNAVSKLGSSSLTAYFNQTYGFIKLDFINIDKSRIVFDLIKVDYIEDLKSKDNIPKLIAKYKKKNSQN